MFAKSSPIDFSTSSCSLTKSMMNTTKQWNTKGNFVSRWIVSRAISMVGVSTASLVDAAGNLGLGVAKTVYSIITGTCEIVGAPFGLKGRVNPLGLKHANKEEAATHLCKVVGHVALAVTNVATSLIAPRAFENLFKDEPGLFGKAASKAAKFAKKAVPSTNTLKKMVPSKKNALIGVAVAGTVVGAGAAAVHLLDISIPNPFRTAEPEGYSYLQIGGGIVAAVAFLFAGNKCRKSENRCALGAKAGCGMARDGTFWTLRKVVGGVINCVGCVTRICKKSSVETAEQQQQRSALEGTGGAGNTDAKREGDGQ